MPNYVEHQDESSAMTRPVHPADEVAPLDSHSRSHTRMRPMSTASRCESRITDGRRSILTSTIPDRTLQLMEKMVESNQNQTELTKKAMEE